MMCTRPFVACGAACCAPRSAKKRCGFAPPALLSRRRRRRETTLWAERKRNTMTIKEMDANAKRKFLARVDHLIDEVPVSKEEAHLVLADLGIDPKQALADTLAVVERFEEEQRKKRVRERFARAERERTAFQAKVLPRVEARA